MAHRVIMLVARAVAAVIVPVSGRLTNHTGFDSAPRYSPDSSKIAWIAERDGNVAANELYVMASDGTSQAAIRLDALRTLPSWSPDNSKLAYVVEGAADSLAVVNADGTGYLNLVMETRDIRQPKFSPDGTKILYRYEQAPGNTEIYVVNVDGTGKTRLTNNTVNDGDPSWKPDGSKIVWVRDGRVWHMNADGSSPAQLYGFSGASHPTYSPNALKIAFLLSTGKLMVMNADGTGLLEIVASGVDISSPPAWSPDSSKIAYSRSNQIWRINADGTGATQLTSSTGANTQPHWSGDGSMIVFTSTRDGNSEIYAIEP